MNKDFISRRLLNSEDMLTLYAWANEKTARENSLNSSEISLEEHEKWFFSRLRSQNSFTNFFYQTESGAPIGLVRVDEKDASWVISIVIDPLFRGKKLAPSILAISLHDFFQKFKHVQQVHAYIKPNNKASIRSFELVAFEITDEIDNVLVLTFDKNKLHLI